MLKDRVVVPEAEMDELLKNVVKLAECFDKLEKVKALIENAPERPKIPDEKGDGWYYGGFDTVELINWFEELKKAVEERTN